MNDTINGSPVVGNARPKCISPRFLTKQNIYVGCGKCAFCIKKQIDSWCLRLTHEMEVSSSAFFLTLTYNEEHIPENGELSKRDLVLFIKRLRKKNPGLRYFAVGEYGSKGNRPHYHAVIFNLDDLQCVTDSWKRLGKEMGFVSGSRATHGRIRYMVSYMALPQDVSHRQPPFRLMSRVPGIGNAYVKKMIKHHRARSDSVVYLFDVANKMPRYYKDKIFTNRYQKKLIQMRALEFAKKQPPPDPVSLAVEHARLFKKLNRKHK